MAAERITVNDVQTFTEKLVAFGAELPEKEQVILRAMLLSASYGSGDVEGHAMALPLRSHVPFAALRDRLQQTTIAILEEMARSSPFYYFDGSYEVFPPETTLSTAPRAQPENAG